MANKDKYAHLLENKEFVEWFWSGQNGNTLIKNLNRNKSREEIVRREKYSPYAYGIVLNVNQAKRFEEDIGEKVEEDLKFVKIGFTQQETHSASKNRMTDVKTKIDAKYEGKTAVLCVVMKNPVDTLKHSEFEKNFRNRWGMPVSDECAKNNDLPFHTEWVLATQDHIDQMITVIDTATKEGNRMDASIFKGMRFDEKKIPEKLRLKYRRK